MVTAVVALAWLLVPAHALADGDPASDVLTSQTAFVPWDAKISTAQTARLDELIAVAQHDGYVAHVALIASPADLGSVSQLWLRPQLYARFLGIELSLSIRGSVIVVMPNGEGVFDPGMPASRAQAALIRSRRATTTRSLGALAIAAVSSLAAADGHPLSAPQSGAPISTARPASADAGSWAAFVIGLALVLLAWAGSLRMKPARFRRRASLPLARD